MKNRFMQIIVGTFLALLMLFGCTQFFVSGQESEPSDSVEKQTERSQRNIVGVWRTVVTSRNCQTGAQVAPTFRGLFTFHQGGTMLESSVASGQTPASRSLSHGLWEKRRGGEGNYSFTYIHNRYDASGVFIGTRKITGTLDLRTSGDSFTTNSLVEAFNADDILIGTGGCSTAVGTRFE